MHHTDTIAAGALMTLVAVTAAAVSAGVAPTATPTPAPTAVPIKCSISTPCAVAINSNHGAGYQGRSATGAGLSGMSAKGPGVYGQSQSGKLLYPGVDGESGESTGDDVGGLFGGRSLSPGIGPQYGVAAYGAVFGVFGETIDTGASADPGYGLSGLDPITTAPSSGDHNAGVLARSTVGSGVLAEANATPVVSLYGGAPVGVYSVAATNSSTSNPNAFAYVAETNSFGIDIHDETNESTAIVEAPDFFFEGNSPSGSVSIDLSGNESLSGTLTMSGGTHVRTRGSHGATMTEYADRATAPQVEDVGEGHLENGRAYVAIDTRLAETIDRRVAYHVFVTPEGDCNGLYVTQKSPAGFEVRELRGGRTSLAFDYRIVAKPVDDDGARLPDAPALPKRVDDGFNAGTLRHLPVALAPEQRMRQHIGERAYAEALQEYRDRLAEGH